MKSFGFPMLQHFTDMRARINQQPLEVCLVLRLVRIVKEGTCGQEHFYQLDISIRVLLQTARVPRPVDCPAERRTPVDGIKNIDWCSSIKQDTCVLRLTEP